ncbi:enhancer of split m2, Bearded family member [Haematobia irritans]|uniref:enhancer of split m2, Bearded family member n=1 Tax=Haematobia irritans TaxID=7368 RepID=UPI003F5019C1
MYTDTKNLANLCVNSTNSTLKMTNIQQNQQQQSDKFKLKKVWKPLLRLMSLKSTTTGKHRSIPNNINLNNAHITHNTPKDLLFTTEVDTHDEEQLSPQSHKLPQLCQQEIEAEYLMGTSSITKEPVEFISRVCVEKTPVNTCSDCVYGRNCQHSKYHGSQDTTTFSQTRPSPQDNFNFFNTEDGYFVWSDTYGDIDEQLLREWYWQNSWQFAENATVC